METPGHNPYEAPRATVFDPLPEHSAGTLIPNGRRVDVGHGATWITDAFTLFARSWGVWVGIGLVFIIGSIALNLIPFVGGIAAMLLTPVILGGLMIGCREAEDGGAIDFRHLGAGFERHAGQLIIVALIYFAAFVAVMIAIFVLVLITAGILGFALSSQAFSSEGALIPILLVALVSMALVMPIIMAYWFAPALVVHHNLNAIDAMKQSFVGCLRNWLPFLLYGLVGVVLMVLATIPLLLGWFVLVPLMFISMYTAYKDIFVDPAH
jgi:uncharacterized membrane protein